MSELIKIFTGGVDGFDSLTPDYGDDYCVNLYRLPRGYHLQVDKSGKPYILCPNGAQVYDLDHVRRNSDTVKFSYPINGRRRTVRLKVDTEATRRMVFGDEPYRSFP